MHITKRLIYIMGNSRSGSTVLDMVLGSHPHAHSVGELVKLPKSGWLHNEFCSCGQHLQNCDFWSRVNKRWEELAMIDQAQYLAIREQFYRSWYVLRPKRLLDNPDFAHFIQAKEAFYQAVFEVSGKDTIIDSSKNPIDAYFATRVPGIELTLLHLVRDSHGVAWSMRKSFEKDLRQGIQHEIKPTPLYKTSKTWMTINLTCSYLGRLFPQNYLRLRYEDFMEDPKSALAALTEKTTIHFTDCLEAIEKGIRPESRHIMAGNRVRMADQVFLKPDLAWQEKLTRTQKGLISLLTFPLLLAYGYLSPGRKKSGTPTANPELHLPIFPQQSLETRSHTPRLNSSSGVSSDSKQNEQALPKDPEVR